MCFVNEIAENNRLLTDNFLLVADEQRDRIVQIDTATMTTQLSIIVTSQPQVLAYDRLRREIYWTSGQNRTSIFKYSFARNESLELHTDKTSSKACFLIFRKLLEIVYHSQLLCPLQLLPGRLVYFAVSVKYYTYFVCLFRLLHVQISESVT